MHLHHALLSSKLLHSADLSCVRAPSTRPLCCCAVVVLCCAVQVGPKAFPRVAMDLATTVERIQQNFVISDPSLPDCPIVFASDAFLELSGYPREEVLGRNCRFLQVRLGCLQ